MSILNERILVTGGLGFIGLNLVKKIVQLHTFCGRGAPVYILDKFNQESNVYDSCPVIYGDIQDENLIFKLLVENQISLVFHFAAETHVDKSIQNPDLFIQNNILGSHALLKACRKYQRIEPDVRIIEINTDEVFGCLQSVDEKHFNEESPFLPNNPYSASKAAVAGLSRAYAKTYGLNILTTHCCNNYGPYQDATKLIPKIIINAIKGEKIPIYGTGENKREWIYVTEHNNALEFLAYNGAFKGERYIIGSGEILSNNEVVKIITDILEEKGVKCKHNITYVEDRKGHDLVYACDNSKLVNMGWKPIIKFEEGIRILIEEYL